MLVFDRFGLHYCCDGEKTLREAARLRGVPPETVIDALVALSEPGEPAGSVRPGTAGLSGLIAQIVVEHHQSARSEAPVITGWLGHLVDCHGVAHPELLVIRETWLALIGQLEPHLVKEEALVFPYIRELEHARETGRRIPGSPFGTVLNPIRMMESEHARHGRLMASIRELSRGFAVPADGCDTYRRCMSALAGFEGNLHCDVHLENTVLFPAAIELERQLL